ncbi:Serine/threonine-protein kinase B [Acaryochloris thomasi RCC1774]|uniref:Serine/threonine-protein kinase B n=1 Tax=Acaryochloris thomasi RCC1774 TaxID=1764569 RepID=A0A2W1JMX7_9CYAN|nr:pentapeptide repeat-containing protein [Acaryochloris thomasi]PZD72795.1 Serine/threonine-protein kinase B [Acaryochloris thomasi RCC1774]
MPEENLLALAQTGDLDAIKQLLNQTLQPHANQVHDICIRKDCLQISIESTNIPNQSTLVPLIQQTISQLQVSQIHALEVYGHTVGDELPHWMQQLDCLASADTTVAATITQTPSTEVSHPETNLPSSPPQSAPIAPSTTANTTAADGPSTPQSQAHNTIHYSPAVEKMVQAYGSGSRDFQQSNFNETDLQGINLTLANLQESQLVWANLSNASLGHANLTHAQLRHANLSNANLQGAKLQGANFIGANLTGANLSWAELRGANFTDADLTDANLLNANLERVTMPDGTYLD